MSRLDSVIARLSAQRDCLNWAVGLIATNPGVILELGLGNGRTYNHLRERLPGRRILVFDRVVQAHPDCVPPVGDLVLGDLPGTLLALDPRPLAALVHADIGSGHDAFDIAFAASLAPVIAEVLIEGGIALCDQPLPDPRLRRLPPPEGVPDGRYHIYLRRA